jgi:hypothetical protein
MIIWIISRQADPPLPPPKKIHCFQKYSTPVPLRREIQKEKIEDEKGRSDPLLPVAVQAGPLFPVTGDRGDLMSY